MVQIKNITATANRDRRGAHQDSDTDVWFEDNTGTINQATLAGVLNLLLLRIEALEKGGKAEGAEGGLADSLLEAHTTGYKAGTADMKQRCLAIVDRLLFGNTAIRLPSTLNNLRDEVAEEKIDD